MGRPPIGDRAMSDAERQRKRRERLVQATGQTAKPAKAAPDLSSIRSAVNGAEIEQLTARVAKLEKDLAYYKKRAAFAEAISARLRGEEPPTRAKKTPRPAKVKTKPDMTPQRLKFETEMRTAFKSLNGDDLLFPGFIKVLVRDYADAEMLRKGIEKIARQSGNRRAGHTGMIDKRTFNRMIKARFHPDKVHGDAALANDLTAVTHILAEFEKKLVR